MPAWAEVGSRLWAPGQAWEELLTAQESERA